MERMGGGRLTDLVKKEAIDFQDARKTLKGNRLEYAANRVRVIVALADSSGKHHSDS